MVKAGYPGGPEQLSGEINDGAPGWNGFSSYQAKARRGFDDANVFDC